ncbi:MAG: hypothetical protein ACRDWT_18625 [Jatrophihabitantaceae bacterium]
MPYDERASAAFDVRVSRHLDVIEQLERVRSNSDQVRRAVDAVAQERTRLINQFLRLHPYQHRNTIEEIRRRGLTGVRFAVLNEGVAQDLAILYIALPYADTSALVAARRIRTAEVLRDVVSSDMSDRFSTDPHGEVIWREFVDQEFETRTKPQSAWWPGVIEFCRQGMEQIDQWQLAKGSYRSVYSRAMWPTAHVLAALYKARNPQTKWIAEFSDPLVRGIAGQPRESNGKPTAAFVGELRDALQSRGVQPPDSDNLYVWIETLAYGLADVVLFTNEHQRDFMLAHCEDRALARRALRHAAIEYHPTLPAKFYQLYEAHYELDPAKVNIGYFGVFYATRGLTEVIDAFRGLRPEIRAKLRLHVFTNKPDELAADVVTAEVGDVIIANPYVSFLELLNLTTKLDVLLINDYRTLGTHGMNPYVPAKWSDYAGSGTPIWAIIEPGSVLSAREVAYRSELGDVDGARAVLERMVADSTNAAPTTIG